MALRSVIKAVDRIGYTTLSRAVYSCSSDPSHAILYSRTPLHIAAHLGDSAMIQLFLAAKADVSSKDSEGFTTLCMASRSRIDITITERLLSYGASIASQYDQELGPLYYTIRHNRPAHLQLLLERGAKIIAVSKPGMVALIIGVMYNAYEALKLLPRNTAPDCNSEEVGWYHWPVLEYSAVFRDLETLHLSTWSFRPDDGF